MTPTKAVGADTAKAAPTRKRTPKVPVPEISIIIPTYQRADRLPALLDDVANQTLDQKRFEVVVVDNCSTDNTSEVVEKLATTLPFRLRVVRTPVNRGPAAARNLGWRSATAPLLAFLDDDCTPEPTWLETGLAAMLAMPKVGVLQGQTKAPPEEYLGPNCRYGPPNWYVFRIIDKPTAQFEACNIFYRREVFEETGGFDENLGWWGEDTAAGWRVLEAGWERAFAEDVIVVHPVEPRGWRWYMKNGLLERNNIRLAAEHPGFRNEGFWRPWAVRREDLAFLIGIVGVLGALRFRPALLLALPYIWWQRPSIRKASFFRLCYQIPALDAARALGHWQGSIENRIFVI